MLAMTLGADPTPQERVKLLKAHSTVAAFVAQAQEFIAKNPKARDMRVFIADPDLLDPALYTSTDVTTGVKTTVVKWPAGLITELDDAWTVLATGMGVLGTRTGIFPLTSAVPGGAAGTTSIRTLGVALPLFIQMNNDVAVTLLKDYGLGPTGAPPRTENGSGWGISASTWIIGAAAVVAVVLGARWIWKMDEAPPRPVMRRPSYSSGQLRRRKITHEYEYAG